MNYSIQYFTQNTTPNFKKIKENFFEHPKQVSELVNGIQEELWKLGCILVGEILEQMDRELCKSIKRKEDWTKINTGNKQLLTSMGIVQYEKTCFQNKKTKKSAYLLDILMGLESHARMTEDVEAEILRQAAQHSYEKTGNSIIAGEIISRQCIKNKIDRLEIPAFVPSKEKRKADYIYVEADEAHVPRQYKEIPGDLKEKKQKGCRLAKLVYIHEGKKKTGSKTELVHAHYIAGTYTGEKENERLWKEVQKYIEDTYEYKNIPKIYFQSDGGSWMKKGKELLDCTFVLDGFHLEKYLRKAVRGCCGEEKEKAKRYLETCVKEKKKALIRKWVEGEKQRQEERYHKSMEKATAYLIEHIEGAGNRLLEIEGITGSSTEGHVSHVLAERLSRNPNGWAERGTDHMAKLRAYIWNDGDLLKLVRMQKKERNAEIEENVVKILSSTQMFHWEKEQEKANGKWIEAIQCVLSPSMKQKMSMQHHIWNL